MYYDLNVIKSIPCQAVAKKLGINLKEKGDRLWGKLRQEENTESFSINLKKNLWYDFGSGKGGSDIDLVMEFEGMSKDEAINWIANEFNIENVKTNTKWWGISDSDYKEIGIQPEKATMNFKFDLNKHSIDQLEIWSKKYGMHVKELAGKFPSVYTRMLDKISLGKIKELRESYYTSLGSYQDKSLNDVSREFLKQSLKQISEDINNRVTLLQKADIRNINYDSYKVNYEKHFQAISKNKNHNQNMTNNDMTKNRIVNIYKKVFDYDLIDYFTMEQILALKDVNKLISKSDNQFLPINSFRKVYKMVGEQIEKLNPVNDAEKLKYLNELFSKCSKVMDGIREANIKQNNELAKQNPINKSLHINEELTR